MGLLPGIFTEIPYQTDYCAEGIEPVETISDMSPEIMKGSIVGLIVAILVYLVIK